MDERLEQINSVDLFAELDRRYLNACDYISQTAKSYPLERRRAIVQHIKDSMKRAETWTDIPSAARELRIQLIHDFWQDATTSADTQNNQALLTDFAVMAIANPPPHQKHLQQILQRIVPEDTPPSPPHRPPLSR